MRSLVALAALGFITTGVACADTNATPTLAPSQIVGSVATYDKQTITVKGTVKNIGTGNTPRGAYTKYDLCDTQCITVMQFGTTDVKNGDQPTVSGRFRAKMGRMHMSNVLLIRKED
jgi:hypothetical protein